MLDARSLNAEKVDELQVIVDDYDIDVACITDTWFREYMDDTSFALVLIGDFNQFNDKFLVSHYRFIQMVKILTRGGAILDKIWTNMT